MKNAIMASIIALSAIGLVGCDRVEPGNVGIKVNKLGDDKGVGEVVGVGRYWTGWNTEVYIFPTFKQMKTYEDAFNFQMSDGTTIGYHIGVAYKVDPTKVTTVFQTYRKGVDDITDTDDGDTRISAGAFWPDIVLRELRLAVRLPGRVTTSRLLHTATGAVAHVTRELEAWQQEQQAAGHQTLADVPAPVINGESVNLWHWRNAVYTATRALILERYRDADTTDKGDRRADALDIQTSDLWRDVSWAISDILCRPRIFAELC